MKRSMPTEHSDQQMSFGWLEPNAHQMAAKAGRLVSSIRDCPSSRTLFLISCGKHKAAGQTRAGDLYTSPRFRTSAAIATRLRQRLLILSAKHGLLSPDDFIEPYDFSLKFMNRGEQLRWAGRVVADLRNFCGTSIDRIILLADEDYVADLLPLLAETGLQIVDPLHGLFEAGRLSFLKSCNRFLDRIEAVCSMYKIFEDVVETASLPSLRDALQRPIPAQGVYFFFDPDERSRFSSTIPRLVRIGTHGVSAGSKATLRDRLRAHLGTGDGFGNHRSSVFRLHIGEALIRRLNLRSKYPHWGKGQNADQNVREQEKPLEQMVSEYVSKLKVISVEVIDKSTKLSARSTIERLSIALFTEDFLPVEEASGDWLGAYSQHEVIATSGLWNIREAGTKADPKVLDLIRNRIDASLKRSSTISRKDKCREP